MPCEVVIPELFIELAKWWFEVFILIEPLVLWSFGVEGKIGIEPSDIWKFVLGSLLLYALLLKTLFEEVFMKFCGNRSVRCLQAEFFWDGVV
jgi:hypothetical protein